MPTEPTHLTAEELDWRDESEHHSRCTYGCCYQKLLAALDSLEAARRELAGRWISVAERLPEGRPVLAWDSEIDAILIVQFYKGQWFYPLSDQQARYKFTHWKPLPTPPAQQEGNTSLDYIDRGKAAEARADDLQRELDELKEYEAEEAAFMAKHNVSYCTTFVDGWARVLDERDSLAETLGDVDATLGSCRYTKSPAECNCDIHAAHRLIAAALGPVAGEGKE